MISVIFDLINIIPLCMSGALFLFPRDEGEWLLYFLPVVIPAICVCFLHMKKRGRLIFTGVIISLASGIILTVGLKAVRDLLIGGEWILYLILFCASIFLYEEAALSHRKLKIISFITMISVLMYMLFSKVRSGRAETALILFYLLITAAEEIQIRRKKEG
ncbi:MAG: hypothetical protein K6F86_10195, partial [Lachnospiraceae bacterium]|nr:hypothetical protein [Lachnospiraceae bacterium]